MAVVVFSICIVEMCIKIEAALIIRFVIELTVRYGFRVCVCAVPSLFYFVPSFSSRFRFLFTFDVYLPPMFVSFLFRPSIFQTLVSLRALKWCNEGKSVKKVYLNKCDTLSNSLDIQYMRAWFCHLLERVACTHWWTCLRSFRGSSYGVVVCCHARKERRHCTVIFLGVCKVDCYSMRKTVSPHFCKWLTHSHPFILSHSEIIGTVPLFCFIHPFVFTAIFRMATAHTYIRNLRTEIMVCMMIMMSMIRAYTLIMHDASTHTRSHSGMNTI